MSHTQQTNEQPHEGKARGITFRAVLIGFILIPFMCWFNFSTEVIRYAGQPTTISLMPHVLALLLLMIGINSLIGRFAPKAKFSVAELITTYFIVAIGQTMASHDLIEVMTPILSYAVKYQNPANKWATDVLPYLPDWLFVSNAKAIDHYYIGNYNFWQWSEMKIWALPLFMWSVFFTVLAFGLFCLNALLRKQWTERERLSYPLVQFTLEIAQPRTPIFRNKMFWIAFGIAAIHDVWFGMASIIPSIPIPYPRITQLEQSITSPPWNAIGSTPLTFYPWIVGIGVLLPTDLLFSMWFFFWIWKLEPVIAAQYGWNQIPGFPFVNQQSAGAYAAIALFTIFTARKALGRGFRAIFFGANGEDVGEPLPYRWAALGFIGALIALFVFFYVAGMSPWVIICTLLIYLIISIAVTRMRAELGVPAHDLHDSGPQRLIPLLGLSYMKNSDIALMAALQGFNRAYRAHPMPVGAEAIRGAERTGGKMSTMFWVMVVAVFWACITGFFINVGLNYHWGAASKVDSPYVSTIFGSEPYNMISGYKAGSVGSIRSGNVVGAMLVGFLITLALAITRLQIINFPLHPVGFAVSSSWSGSMLWFSLLVAWIYKTTLMKIGGLKLFQKAMPFFLGLTLGECVVGTFWYFMSAFVTHSKTFIVWPM